MDFNTECAVPKMTIYGSFRGQNASKKPIKTIGPPNRTTPPEIHFDRTGPPEDSGRNRVEFDSDFDMTYAAIK
jgi:hypothetical protein